MINVISFLVLSTALVYFGFTKLVVTQAKGSHINAEFADASGLRPRNDVTMRGVVVGTIADLALTENGVNVDMELSPGVEVPEGTHALIVRRSPIGELTIELEPGQGEPLTGGSTIAVADTMPPPDVAETIRIFSDFLASVPSEDLTTVVSELALAVDGRAKDLAAFTDASLELPERLLEIEPELESLIENGPELTGVLADNADTLADDLSQTAVLADILRDRRYDLVQLYGSGAEFSRVAGDLLEDEKANISCLISDIGAVNAALAERKDLLAATLEKNHFFFDAAEQAVQKDGRGWTWFRVQLLPHTEPGAREYASPVGVPDVLPGQRCKSRYGTGVGPVEKGSLQLAPGSNFQG
jgi:phospholipid/cholesterol/gamma-HCH transport system substrate-binding protein